MPSLSYEVGAVFMIEDRATSVLTEISRAFESLGELAASIEERLMGIGEGAFAPLMAGLERATSATQLMVDQVGRVADAWGAAASAAERYGIAAGGAGGVGGGRGGGAAAGGAEGEAAAAAAGAAGGGGRRRGGRQPAVSDEEREAARQLAEDRRNAEAINRNENQIYSRQEAAARRDNASYNARMSRQQRERGGGGIYGPSPYEIEGADSYEEAGRMNERFDSGERLNAEAENSNFNQVQRRRESERAARTRTEDAAIGHIGGVFSGLGPMIGLGAGYGAYKGAFEEDRSLAQSLQEMGYDPRAPGFQGLMDEMRGKVSGATANTIYSESHGASVLPGTAGQFSGLYNTPDTRKQAYEAVLPEALKFAEVAEQYHRGSIGESYKAGIGYLTMTGQTDEKGATLGLAQLLNLSLATGNSISREQDTLKYALPIAKAAGADLNDAAALTGMMEILGFRGTTAGTGVGQIIVGLTNTGGPVAAQQQREQNVAKAFESILHLDPKSAQRAVKAPHEKEHDIALRELHLTDATGKISQEVAPGGSLNMQALIEHISGSLQTMTPMRGLEVLRNAFTVRGSREAAELKDPETVARLLDFFKIQKDPPKIDELQKQLATRPLQQFEQMLANIANIGNTLATATLGPLNESFKTMNTWLVGFNNFLKEHQTIAATGGWAAGASVTAAAVGVGARAAWRLTGARALYRGASSLLSGAGGAAEAAGPAIGEEALAGLGGGSLLGPLGLLGGGLLAAGSAAGGMNAPMVDDYGRQIGTWGGKPNAMTPQQNHVTVSLGPVTMYGVPDDSSLHSFMKKLTDGIRDAMSHMTSDAAGTGMSMYTQPGL